MEFRKTLLCLTVAFLVTFASGCAPAYHCYSGCSVPCKYCPPSPLPYTQSGDCSCHSSVAERYLANPQETSATMPTTPNRPGEG